MIIKLPLSSDAAQSFVTQLGSNKYRFDVRYNDRSQAWVMDIMDDATQTLLISGLGILLGCDMLQAYNLSLQGYLMAVDRSGQGQDAGDSDLGDRVNVYWFSPDEPLT